jgi:pimeloyl-ACP methyl ester carboxylesterase
MEVMMLQSIRILVLALIGCVSPTPAVAVEPKDVGVVLLHGWGLQDEPRRVNPHAQNWLLSKSLREAGFHVIEEEMPWGPNRLIDVSLERAMEEIDAQVAKLKTQGASRIVIAGHSMGTPMALAYASQRSGIAGVIGLAPGFHPEFGVVLFPESFPAQLAKARAAIASGNGDERTTFTAAQCCFFLRDFWTTPNIYLSYFDPKGPATMARSAPRIKDGVPVLLVYGKHDFIFTLFAQAKLPYFDHVWSRLPANPRHKRITVEADHGSVPSRAVQDVIGWLRALP